MKLNKSEQSTSEQQQVNFRLPAASEVARPDLGPPQSHVQWAPGALSSYLEAARECSWLNISI